VRTRRDRDRTQERERGSSCNGELTITRSGERGACVTPQLSSRNRGLTDGFHQFTLVLLNTVHALYAWGRPPRHVCAACWRCLLTYLLGTDLLTRMRWARNLQLIHIRETRTHTGPRTPLSRRGWLGRGGFRFLLWRCWTSWPGMRGRSLRGRDERNIYAECKSRAVILLRTRVTAVCSLSR